MSYPMKRVYDRTMIVPYDGPNNTITVRASRGRLCLSDICIGFPDINAARYLAPRSVLVLIRHLVYALLALAWDAVRRPRL